MSDQTYRRGAWMQTYTGRQFYPLDPRAQDVHPADIAHALSLLCRYGGHVDRFYSVAEHCFLLSHAVAPRHALWALLHDATEAYVGDMVRPLKHQLPEYCAAEDLVMVAVAERFGLRGQMPDEVKEADSRILLDERAALMSCTRHPWVQDTDGTEPLGVQITGWDPRFAEDMYTRRLNELFAGSPANQVVHGMCTACGAVEVALSKATGTRDLSDIGEAADYPTGHGCEACT